MKKNFDYELKDLEGKPFEIEKGKPATARSVAIFALMLNDDKNNPSGDDKAKQYKLAMRIHDGGEQEVTPEELTLLKRLIGIYFAPLVVGQMYDFLNA